MSAFYDDLKQRMVEVETMQNDLIDQAARVADRVRRVVVHGYSNGSKTIQDSILARHAKQAKASESE